MIDDVSENNDNTLDNSVLYLCDVAEWTFVQPFEKENIINPIQQEQHTFLKNQDQANASDFHKKALAFWANSVHNDKVDAE